MQPTDTQIIDALIAKDEKMTHDFFFVWCRPLLYSIIRKVFNYDVDYEELAVEMNTSVANLYNIKRRALVELTAIALKEFENGEK